MTCTATIVADSHCVGLTLPGMIELPGSFDGIVISPRPQRGPLASQRTSLAIFMRFVASPFKAPCAKTISSFAESAWNLFGAVRKSSPVMSLTTRATSSAKPSGALSPVPTAVPPKASSFKNGSVASICARDSLSMASQPLISCVKEMGTASCKCVLPVLTIPSFSFIKRSKVEASLSIDGRSLSSMATTAAMCIAVGNVSFELCDILQWSFGCSSFSPAISLPRFASTSLTFMFDCVPLPVCHTASGKCPSRSPARISSAAFAMASRRFSSSLPSVALANAADFFKMAKARMISFGIFSVPMGKFSKLLCVCAPQ